MGWSLLVVAAVASTLATGVGFRARSAERRLQFVSLASLGAATVVAWWLLASENTRYELVADHTRPGLALHRRLMGLWGGAEGSLLFFTLIVGAVLVTAPIPDGRRSVASATIAGLSWTLVVISSPFEQLTNQPIAGSGLSPILEHWAMTIHPPLLYLGLALALVPSIAPAASPRWTRAAIATLTVALALGGFWAYEEVGWGGWWAWDPVENVALIPWLLLTTPLHAGRRTALPEWALALVWPAVFAGTATTRTSLRTSVHSFANADGLAWALWPLAAGAGIVAVVLAVRNSTRPTRWTLRQSLPAAIVFWTAVVVALGTFRPFLSGSTEGTFYTRYLFPVVIVGLVAMGVVPHWRRPTHGRAVVGALAGAALGLSLAAVGDASSWWQWVFAGAAGAALGATVAGDLNNPRRAVAHLGMTAVLIGALGATASNQQTVELAEGASRIVVGHRIENLGASLVAEEPPVIGARIRVDDDHVLEPALTVFAERRLRLPEVATQRGLLEDVQVILRSADDDGSALLTVNAQPLTQFVWLGATAILAAMALPGRRRDSATRRREAMLAP